MRTVILYLTEQAPSTLGKMVAPRWSISGCCYHGMFLASRLVQGSTPRFQACEGQGAGMGLSHQVDISGSTARTPKQISSSWTSDVGANVSTFADGQASVPTALDRTGPLVWQLLASQPARRSASWHVLEEQVSPSSSELWEHVCLHTVNVPVCVCVPPIQLIATENKCLDRVGVK